MKQYKVRIHVEEIDEEQDLYQDIAAWTMEVGCSPIPEEAHDIALSLARSETNLACVGRALALCMDYIEEQHRLDYKDGLTQDEDHWVMPEARTAFALVKDLVQREG